LFEFNLVDTINKEIYSQILENALDIKSISYNLADIESKKIYINPIDDLNILTKNNKVIFKNIINENIYPFIWIESEIDSEFVSNSYPELSLDKSDNDSESDSIYNKLLSGTPIYSHSELSDDLNSDDLKYYQNRAIAYHDYGVLKAQKIPRLYDKPRAIEALKACIIDFQKVLEANPGRKDIATQLEEARSHLQNVSKQ
jgi:hypothetical protein